MPALHHSGQAWLGPELGKSEIGHSEQVGTRELEVRR